MTSEIAGWRFLSHLPSGMPIGPLAPIYAEDIAYISVPDWATIWRFMDFWKFEAMIKNGGLYFSRVDKLSDPLEGLKVHSDPTIFSKSDQEFNKNYRPSPVLESRNHSENIMRHVCFASCWHLNTEDTTTMWNAYTTSHESVVVKSTVGRLRSLLPISIIQKGVTYLPQERPKTEFDHFSLMFAKEQQYSFEREFRLLRPPNDNENFEAEDVHRYVPLPLDVAIHRIVTHPKSTLEFQQKVKQILKRENLTIRVKASKAK